jgi:hypothetical protein
LGASLKPFDSHLRLQELALRLGGCPAFKKGSSTTTEEDAHAQVHNDSPSTYSIADFDTYSDNIAVCRKSSTSSPPKPTAKLMAIPKTGGSSKKADELATVHEHIPPVVTTPIPSSSEGTNWTVLSTAEAWNSSRRVTKFLESLKNREADQKGTPFAPLLHQSP